MTNRNTLLNSNLTHNTLSNDNPSHGSCEITFLSIEQRRKVLNKDELARGQPSFLYFFSFKETAQREQEDKKKHTHKLPSLV